MKTQVRRMPKDHVQRNIIASQQILDKIDGN